MIRTGLLLLTFFAFSNSFGQPTNNSKPFVIQGQLTNCAEEYLTIFLKDINGKSVTDTLHLDNAGKFYLKTFKVTYPQRANIQKNKIQINDIFVASGYDLTLTGNAQNFKTLFTSKKISGIGSESNRYRFILDSLNAVKADKRNYWELKQSDLVQFISLQKKVADSVAGTVFSKKAVQDKYLKFFGKMTQLDNTFLFLDVLLAHRTISGYGIENTEIMIKDNFDPKILKNLYKEDYLISNQYKTLMTGFYADYIVSLDYKKDSTLKNIKNYKLEKINNTYKGVIKEYVFYNLMSPSVEFCKSTFQLNYYKDLFEPYISALNNSIYRNTLLETFANKEQELVQTQIGKPAPNFKLENNFGQLFSLLDFKGKVVYIDLWASWCAPCRAETPSFKLLNDKYKNDDRISFISVAVNDGIYEWKKALSEDNPDWLQLIDKDGIVWKSYTAYEIPKFIIIDKKGNIANFDAPAPSSKESIEKLLDIEIAK